MDRKIGYQHLNQAQRDRLQALVDGRVKQKEIAKILGVSPSTISREVKRNCRKLVTERGTRDGPYESEVAEHKAYLNRKYAKFQWKKINEDEGLRTYIIDKLEQYWGPDEISGHMRKTKQPFYASKTAIYEWLRSNRGQYYCRYLYSGRYRPEKQNKNKTKKVLIPNRISIHLRSELINQKLEYGHYEGDTIVSAKKTASKAALSVTYERKAKFIDARKIKNMKPDSHNRALINMFQNKKALSLTQDNGIENTRHQELGLDTYFCDPYSSWQKPGVEHANKMIRRFIPKGSNINDYSDEYVSMVVTILNNKPRKSLGYKTPNEVMIENNLFKFNPKNCT